MKMPVLIFFMGLSFPFSVNSDVYKCEMPPGKLTYRAEPCIERYQNHGVVKIEEIPPEERDAAKAS